VPNVDDLEFWPEEVSSDRETAAAQGRMPHRTYASDGFVINVEASRDFGQPARFVYKVFDNEHEAEIATGGESWVVSESPGGRYQIKLLIAREAGRVKDLWIHRVATGHGRARQVLHLDRENANKLVELIRTLDHIPVTGDVTRVRVDDSLIRGLFESPESIASIYSEDPARFRELIRSDASSRDVIAIAHRREQLEEFRRLLDDPDYFDVRAAADGGQETVWQQLLERNPWILGISLAGQLMTSWDAERLERVVVGASIGSVGKRADAVMRTAGRIKAMVFAEIKHHRTPLLGKEYRSGCWSPSEELAGGVVQAQGTVQRGVEALGVRLPELAEDGSEIPGEFAYLLRPRSYLIVGQLDQLVGQAGGHHLDRIRSFELFRRHLDAPEVVTFDELLARAEWMVEASTAGQDA
jgi:hypothetical protein